MADWLDIAYGWLEKYQVSPQLLIFATVLLVLALLLASREAASWFFKTQDIKRDVARLEEICLQLEGEIRSLQSLIRQQLNAADATMPAAGEPAPLMPVTEEAALPPLSKAPAEAPATPKPQFPFVH